MRVIVQNIQPCSTGSENSFNVFALLDNRQCRFILKVEIDKIVDRELQRVTTDQVFDNLFRYDLGMYSHICKLVSAVYNHRPIELPCDVGELEIKKEEATIDLTKARIGSGFHVVRSDGKWLLKEGENNSSVSLYSTQREAIEAGESMARTRKTELVIHRPNGEIREVRSYGTDRSKIIIKDDKNLVS